MWLPQIQVVRGYLEIFELQTQKPASVAGWEVLFQYPCIRMTGQYIEVYVSKFHYEKVEG